MTANAFEDFTTRKMSRKSFFVSLGIFCLGGVCVYLFDIFDPRAEQGFGSHAYGTGPYGR